jgi:DNA-binding Lrp family transcriptional regulator
MPWALSFASFHGPPDSFRQPFFLPGIGLCMDERRELLEVLLTDARTNTADIARQLDLSEPEVETLIDDLESEGVIKGYQAVVDWEELEEDHARALVELNVELDRETSYADIASRIVKFPEVNSLRLVSGEYDFAIEVEGESMHDVSAFVADRIAPVPEITQTVTHFIMTSYKERGVAFDGDEEDDRLSVSP